MQRAMRISAFGIHRGAAMPQSAGEIFRNHAFRNAKLRGDARMAQPVDTGEKKRAADIRRKFGERGIKLMKALAALKRGLGRGSLVANILGEAIAKERRAKTALAAEEIYRNVGGDAEDIGAGIFDRGSGASERGKAQPN